MFRASQVYGEASPGKGAPGGGFHPASQGALGGGFGGAPGGGFGGSTGGGYGKGQFGGGGATSSSWGSSNNNSGKGSFGKGGQSYGGSGGSQGYAGGKSGGKSYGGGAPAPAPAPSWGGTSNQSWGGGGSQSWGGSGGQSWGGGGTKVSNQGNTWGNSSGGADYSNSSGGKSYGKWENSGAQRSTPYSAPAGKPASKPQKGSSYPTFVPPAKKEPIPQPTQNTVVAYCPGKAPPGFEKSFEEKVHSIAVDKGFSTPDEVRYITSSCYIDFPHRDAAKEFLDTLNGSLDVDGRRYKLSLQGYFSGKDRQGEQKEGLASSSKTDTLQIKLITGLTEKEILEAMQKLTPQIKSCQIPKNWAGKPKGFALVKFYSIAEAELTLKKMDVTGCMIGTRKVSVEFSQPETDEDVYIQKEMKDQEDAKIKENAEQAVTGINGSMWAAYMKMFETGSESA